MPVATGTRRTPLQVSTKPRAAVVHYLPILCIAGALRVIVAVAAARGDARLWFYSQATEMSCLAQSMLAGHGFGSPFGGATGPSAFIAPGYPVLIAAAFRLFGPYTLHAAVFLVGLQILFGVATVAVVMRCAVRLRSAHCANIVGCLCALSPPMVNLPLIYWETSLSTLLLTGVVLLALRCSSKPLPRNWAAFGVYCAFGMYVNPALMTVFAAVLAWAGYRCRTRFWRGPLLAAAIWLLLIAPWPIRNAIRMHAFIPLRSNLGYELWQGNRIGSTGSFTANLHPNASNDGFQTYAKVGEVAYVRQKSAEAVAAINANPARFLRLSLKRCATFWFNLGHYRSSAILTIDITCFSLTAMAGLVFLFRRSRSSGILLSIPFVVFPAPYYFTHADFRFRLLLEPLALLLTTLLIDECFRYAQAESSQEGARSAN